MRVKTVILHKDLASIIDCCRSLQLKYTLKDNLVDNISIRCEGYREGNSIRHNVMEIVCKTIYVQADSKRRKLMTKASQCGRKVAAQAFMMDESEDDALLERKLQEAHFNRDPGSLKDLDLSMKAATDKFQNKIAK